MLFAGLRSARRPTPVSVCRLHFSLWPPCLSSSYYIYSFQCNFLYIATTVQCSEILTLILYLISTYTIFINSSLSYSSPYIPFYSSQVSFCFNLSCDNYFYFIDASKLYVIVCNCSQCNCLQLFIKARICIPIVVCDFL